MLVLDNASGMTCRSPPLAIRTSSSSTPSAMPGTGPATTCWPPGTTRRRSCSQPLTRGSSSRGRSSGCCRARGGDVHAVGLQLVTESGSGIPRPRRAARVPPGRAGGGKQPLPPPRRAGRRGLVSGAACWSCGAPSGGADRSSSRPEEEDLFLRIRRAGGRVLYLPSVRVRHDEAAARRATRTCPPSAARFADKHIRSRLQRRVMPASTRPSPSGAGAVRPRSCWPLITLLHNRYRRPAGRSAAVEDLAWLIRTELGEPAAVLERDSSSLGRGRAAAGLLGGGGDGAAIAGAVRTRVPAVHAHNVHPASGWRALAAARARAPAWCCTCTTTGSCARSAPASRTARTARAVTGATRCPVIRLNRRGSRAESLAYGAALAFQGARLAEYADAFVVPSEFAQSVTRLGAPWRPRAGDPVGPAVIRGALCGPARVDGSPRAG